MDVVAIRVWIQQNILTLQETYQLCIEKKKQKQTNKKTPNLKLLFYKNIVFQLSKCPGKIMKNKTYFLRKRYFWEPHPS